MLGRGTCGCADAKAVGVRPRNVPDVAACGGGGLFVRVYPLRRCWGVAPAVALMQGGGGGGRRWGGVLRSGTVEAVRVAALNFREHPKKHIILWDTGS